MKTFRLKIVTPRGIYREVEVEMLNLNTTSGQLGILANHMPLASGLAVGSMNYIQNGERTYFALSGGFVYVNDSETTVLANEIESQEDIDLNRAQSAKQRAENRLKNHNDDIDIKRAQIALQKAINRIHVKGI